MGISTMRGWKISKNIEEEEEEEENAKDKFNSCTNIICIGNIHIAFIAHQIIFHQLS